MNYNRFSANSPPVIGSIYHYKLSYLAFICLGLGVVLPFHFFIIADPYFHYKLHNSHSVNESISFLELSYENFVILFSSLPNLVTVLLVTFIFVPYIHKYRIYASFFGIAICFVICLLFAFVDVTQWSVAFFILTMVFVVIQSICSAVASNCLFSLTSTLPSRYIQGFVSGQALGGLFVIICSILSILVSSNILKSTIIYFSIAIIVSLSNIIIYYFLEKSHLLQIYSSSVQEVNNTHEVLFHESLSSSYSSSGYVHHSSVFSTLSLYSRIKMTYKSIKWNFYGIFITFIATFSIFPAYLSKIQPSHPSINHSNTLWNERLYAQVMTFLLFYLGDTFGRMISSKIRLPSVSRPYLLFSICSMRLLFIILFGFCNFPNANRFPYLFQYDYIYGFLVLLFSVSHGYCNSINMIYAPRRVHEQLSSTVGALMMMALTSGSFVGSILSYGVVAMYNVNKSSI